MARIDCVLETTPLLALYKLHLHFSLMSSSRPESEKGVLRCVYMSALDLVCIKGEMCPVLFLLKGVVASVLPSAVLCWEPDVHSKYVLLPHFSCYMFKSCP